MARKTFSKPLRMMSIVLAVAILASVTALVVSRIEPHYEGRSLTKWLEQAQGAYAGCQDPEHPELEPAWQECQTAAKEMGTKSLPFLLRWTQAKDSDAKIEVIRWLNRHPSFHVEIHPDPALRKHIQAMYGFNLLGTNASPALPALVEMTHDKGRDRRFWGFVSLASTRPDKEILAPVVARLLKDPDSEIKNTAAQVFFELYPEEAKRLGVCELFPEICNPATNVVNSTHVH